VKPDGISPLGTRRGAVHRLCAGRGDARGGGLRPVRGGPAKGHAPEIQTAQQQQLIGAGARQRVLDPRAGRPEMPLREPQMKA
jgi:hypothetical protein